MLSLRTSVIGPLLTQDAVAKAQETLALNLELPVDTEADIAPPVGIPGRPAKPTLVSPKAIKKISLITTEGRAALLHALAHIEFNAIDLALDIVWHPRLGANRQRRGVSFHPPSGPPGQSWL